ncbi:MAG TPA: hypothetical protein VGM28_00530, partial [Candidatus Limnocylindrales bacterium]
MSRFALIATAAAAVALAVGAFAIVIPKPSGVIVGPGAAVSSPSPIPTEAPTATPTPIPSPSIDPLNTSLWSTYQSDQYGFSVGYPADWTVTPASRAWKLDADGPILDPLSKGMDHFLMPRGQGIGVSLWSVPLDPAVTVDTVDDLESWAADYCAATKNSPCNGIAAHATLLCNERRDCHPAFLVEFQNDVQAFFTGGNYTGIVIAA